MNRFVKGMLLGVGIGLLVAPMRGEEMRQRLSERLNEFRGYLPEGDQIDQYRQQISERVSQTTDSLKGYAQQAASTVRTGTKSTAGNLSDIGQNASSTAKQTGRDVADKTRETANSIKADTKPGL
jgi:gas vesicle protein